MVKWYGVVESPAVTRDFSSSNNQPKRAVATTRNRVTPVLLDCEGGDQIIPEQAAKIQMSDIQRISLRPPAMSDGFAAAGESVI